MQAAYFKFIVLSDFEQKVCKTTVCKRVGNKSRDIFADSSFEHLLFLVLFIEVEILCES